MPRRLSRPLPVPLLFLAVGAIVCGPVPPGFAQEAPPANATGTAQTNPPTNPPTDPANATRADLPPEAMLKRAVESVRSGEMAAAARDLEKVVAAQPDNADALEWYGYVLLRQNKASQAIPYLERAVALKPTVADNYTNLGNALLVKPNRTAADTKKAIGMFEQAVTLDPNSGEAQYNLGFVYARAGQYAKAVPAYQKAVKLRPKDGRAWTNLGYALHQTGKRDDAARALHEGATLAPQDAGTWAMLGSLELERGDRDAALNALETARKLDPKNYAALMNLGRAYADAGRYPEAAATFSEAADIAESRPNVKPDAAARYNQGVVLAKWGKLDDAMTAYDKALTLDPQYYDALVNSGFVLYRQNKADEAITRFKQATALRPNGALAWTNLAAAYEQKKDTTNAALSWRKAISAEPGRYEYHQFLLADLLKLKKYDSAAQVCRKMAVLRPSSAEPLTRMGLAYQAQAESVTDGAQQRATLLKAQAAFQEAGQRDQRSATIRNNLGVVYEKLGNVPQAVILYRQALALNPSYADARKNLERLGAPTTPAALTPVPKPAVSVVPAFAKPPATAGAVPSAATPTVQGVPGAKPAVRKPVRRRVYYRRPVPVAPAAGVITESTARGSVKPVAARPGIKPAPKPAAKPGVRPAPRPLGVRPTGAKPALVKPGVKPAPRPAVGKFGAKPIVRPAAKKPGAKPGVKPAPRPAAKKPAAKPGGTVPKPAPPR